MKKILTLLILVAVHLYGAYSPQSFPFNVGTRQSSPYVFSDGATTNRAIVQQPGARGNLAGAATASWVGWVEVPTSNPSSGVVIYAITPSASSVFATGRVTHAQINTSGNLLIYETGALGSDYREVRYNNFRTEFSGQRVWLDVRYVSGVSSPTIRANGVPLAATTGTPSGTPPNWLDANLSSSFHLTGFSWPQGTLPLGQWINSHLTDAESESWRLTGRPPKWVSDGGSQVQIAADTSFAAFTGTVDDATPDTFTNWEAGANVDALAITGGVRLLRKAGYAANASGSNLFLQGTNRNAAISQLLLQGKVRYKIRARWVGAATTLQVWACRTTNSGHALTNSFADYEGEIPNMGGNRDLSFNMGIGNVGEGIEVQSIQVWVVGALSLPQVQPGTANVLDATLIGGNDAYLVGMTGVTGTDAMQTEAMLEQEALTKDAAPYFFSDGYTANRGIAQYPGARGNLAGAATASWCGWVNVPTTASSANTYMFFVSVSSSPAEGEANSISMMIRSDGTCRLRTNGATATVDGRWRDWANFRSRYSGQRIWLEVRFTAGTVFPVVRIDGVDVTANFGSVDTTQGTPPAWLASTLAAGTHLLGYAWPQGTLPHGQWLNTHLTNAESEAWRTTGVPPAWVVLGGHRSVYTSDFSAGLDGFSDNTGGQATLTGNVDGIAGVNDVLQVSRGTTGTVQINRAATSNLWRQVRVVFDYYADSASGLTGIFIGGVGAAQTNTISIVEGSWQTNQVLLSSQVFTASNDMFTCTGALAVGKNLYIKNVRVEWLGALSLLRPQAIPVADDWTTLGNNPGRLVGVVGITPDRRWRIVASSSTSGNQQLLGGSVFPDLNRNRIESWVIANMGANTRTVSLGNVSGGSQYGSALSVPVGLTDVTPTTRFNATADLWVNSNGTDQLLHTISGQRVGNN